MKSKMYQIQSMQHNGNPVKLWKIKFFRH